MTGTSWNRPQLNKLERAIMEGAFDLGALVGSSQLGEKTAMEARTLLSAMLARHPGARPTGASHWALRL